MEFKTRELAEKLNVGKTWVEYMFNSRIVIPDIVDMPGRGASRVGSEVTLIKLAMVDFFENHMGLSLGRIQDILNSIERNASGFFKDDRYGNSIEFVYIFQLSFGAVGGRVVDLGPKGQIDVSKILEDRFPFNDYTDFSLIVCGRAKKKALEYKGLSLT